MSTKSPAALAALAAIEARKTAHLNRPKLMKEMIDYHPVLDIVACRMFNMQIQLWVGGHFVNVEDPVKEVADLKQLTTRQVMDVCRVMYGIEF